MRLLALLLSVAALAGAARADEIDLTPRERHSRRAPTLVLRAEGGSDFAPYGYAGGCVSWLVGSSFELEGGLGAGLPGVQAGLAARYLAGEGGSHLVSELALAGNTRQTRGGDTNAAATPNGLLGSSHLWTLLGLGFEQRDGTLDVSLVGSLVFTTASLTPHFAVHGGIGFAF